MQNLLKTIHSSLGKAEKSALFLYPKTIRKFDGVDQFFSLNSINKKNQQLKKDFEKISLNGAIGIFSTCEYLLYKKLIIFNVGFLRCPST
jgi:hypothetical protein